MFKTVNSIDACTNGTSIFTIKLLNSSTQTSNNIVLVDSLGSDWEFLDAYSSVGVVGTFNPSDSKIKWVLGSLAPGDSALWHITTTAHTPGTIHNYVWIDSLGGNIVGREAIESYVIVSNFHAPSAASITPLNPIMCVGDSVLLTASFEGASAYKWYLDYVELPGGDLEGHWAKDTGKYSMIYFDGVCFSEMSNIVTVTQLDTVKGGKIGYNQNPLLGSVPEILISLVPASGGTGDFAYQWQKKEAGGFWQDINYATNPDYLPEAVEPLLYRYRRKVTSGTCAAVYSDTVIILPLRPLALEYSACQGASIEIGFVPITNEDLDWYDAQTGGQIVLNHQFRYRKNKDSTLVETYWVEQIYNGITFPRYRVDLELSPNCGVIDPTGCAATGTVLFKEDFGGNLPTDDSYKSSGIPQVLHSYGYKCSVPLENRKYCIRKQTDNNNGLWYKIDDHTFPNDTSRGYLLSVSGALGERYFYRQQIDNLCANSQLYFSFWVVSLDAVTEHNNKKYAAVNLKIKLETLDGTLLKEFAMGDVPFPDSNWKYYGTDFTVPAGHSSIVFAINNYDVSALVHGNNFAIDDIEVRFCAPPVTIEQPARLDTTLCTGTSFTFTGNYTDDGTFGSNLAYRWEHNTGDINNPDDWIFISGTEETSNTGSLTSTYTINPIEANHAGYYRLVVANEENIDNYNCRAMSEIIHLQVVPNVISGTASADQTICYNTQPAPLTSTAATGGSSFITYQWQESTDGGTVWSNVSGGTGETSLDYTPPVLTQTTKYRLMATGGTASCQRVYTNEITISVRSVCAVTDSIIASCDQILPFDVLANDIVSTGCSPVKVEIVTNPVRGNATVLGDNTIKYDGNHSGLDSLMYLVTCGGVRQDSAKVYINIKHDSAFMDDVWYYGEDAEGIRFVNNNGIYIAEDASGESKVNSHENSLVVSSPYCNGQVIFYSSHNQLYNNLHEPMTNGSFMGHQSIADGLAACYMGNNKYLFFSVTNSYEGGDRGLKAYIVDMNADHGKGAIEDSIIIEPPSNNMSESIELLAANEPHKYWLIYAYQNGTHYDLHVHKVDVEDATPVKGLTTQTAATTTSNYRPYTLKASHQHNQIALANRDLKTVDVFDFNISTGLLSNRRTTPVDHKVDGIAYGVEFSPDGNQLYAAGYTQNGGTPLLCQYTITSTSLNYVGGIQYWEHVSSLSKGGGLKLGPDGNIYVVLAYDSNVGVISNPDLMTPLSDRYSKMHLNYNPSSYALQFSTGITKPSVRECNTNLAPTTQADETVLCVSPTSETVTVNVLQNDQDIDNNNIFLTSANFVLEADTSRASLTVNAADSSITLTLKTGVNIAEGYVFEILYNIKDDGLPASQCATGLLTITVHFFPSLNSTLSPPSICSGTSFNYTATATTANATFSWSRAAVTGIDGIATGTGKTIDEVLTNTTNDSIRVTYLVTINSENCIHTDTVRVGVYAPLSGGSIIPNTAQEYCYGGVQPLIHLGTALPTGGSGNYTYQWESSTNSIDFSTLGVLTQTYEINTSLSQTTWLRRAVTDAVCGKVYSDVAQITIHPLPVISSGLTTLCVGLTTTLSPNTGGVWTSSDSSVVDIIVNGYTIEGKSAGTATLTYTSNTTGCTDNITITVNPYPDDPAEITGEKVVCIGEEIQLSNDTLGGVWMYNNSNISIDNPTANPVKVKGLSEGRSFITYTVSNGICQTKKTFRLKVIPNTPPKIIIGIER
ncbi:MAG: DUF11 domain-containing protein [Bacteroidales bacterium]|jgi:uncharacterized repeat protein (TIGR01451 family)|nr:DUF11 domain-containing protein [Bacteroidales bacterium]